MGFYYEHTMFACFSILAQPQFGWEHKWARMAHVDIFSLILVVIGPKDVSTPIWVKVEKAEVHSYCPFGARISVLHFCPLQPQVQL